MCRYIKARYSTRCELLATILMLLSIMLVTGSQFKSGGLLAQSLFGWSPATAIIIFAAIVAAYTCIGGLLGVAYNDTFNLIFGACGLTVCLVAGLLNIGGIPAIMETMTPERLDPRPFGDWVWAVDYLASSTFVMLAVPELIQRIWGCKTGKTARRACTVGGIVYIVLGVMSLGLGLIAYVVLPNIIVNGRILMKDHEILSMDRVKVSEAAWQAARRIWGRIPNLQELSPLACPIY